MATTVQQTPIQFGGTCAEIGAGATKRLFRYRVPEKVTACLLVHAAARDITTDDGAGYVRSATFKRGTGNVVQVGTLAIVATAEDDAAWTVDIVATNSGNDHFIDVNATGDAANVTRWSCNGTIVLASENQGNAVQEPTG